MVLKNKSNTVVLFLLVVALFLLLLNINIRTLSWLPDVIRRYYGYIERGLTYFVLLCMATIAMGADEIPVRSLGISRKNLLDSIPILLTLIIGHLLLANINGGWGEVIERADFSMLISTVIMNLIIVAFSEEYIYRGYVQNDFTKHNGLIKGLVFSSLGFSLAHLPADFNNTIVFSDYWELILYSTVLLMNRLIISLFVFV